MNPTFSATRVAVITTVILGLFVCRASATQDPIPGIDIIVRKNPGGRAIKATTDKAGRFNFENLPAGQYVLSVTPPQLKAIITTRSNIKRPSMRMVNEVQVADASVELGSGSASIEIELTGAKGRITGTVARAPVPKSSEGR